ncbi:MAG: MCP four helix bundle domain-containing protein, partial [Beijerinckiaceae bacterium]|nr:MCP four helix bundle domain-containing protein [Beijerinckiaceae bacterium]
MRLSIKMKLAGAFGLVVVLTAAVGGVAYLKLATMNETVDRITIKRVGALQFAQRAETAVLQSIRDEKNAILATSDDEARRYVQTANDEYKMTLDLIAEAKEAVVPATKVYFEKLQSAVESNWAIQKKVLGYSVINSQRKAHVLIVEKGLQVHAAAVEAVSKLIDSVTKAKTVSGQDDVGPVTKLRSAIELVWADTLLAVSAETVEETDKINSVHLPLVNGVDNQLDVLRSKLDAGHLDGSVDEAVKV